MGKYELINMFFSNLNNKCLGYRHLMNMSVKDLNKHIIKYKLKNASEGEVVVYAGIELVVIKGVLCQTKRLSA